mgnify:CR=1 FL=1
MMKVNENDLFYICSLIESVSRKSGNSKADIVDTLGEKKSFDVCIDLPISITVCQ